MSFPNFVRVFNEWFFRLVSSKLEKKTAPNPFLALQPFISSLINRRNLFARLYRVKTAA